MKRKIHGDIKLADRYLFTSFKELAKPSYLNEINSRRRIFFELVRILLSGLLCFIIIQFFVSRLFFSTGVTGLALIFADFAAASNKTIGSTTGNHTIYYGFILYGGFFVMNIPIFIYGWSRLEKTLFWYSLLYIIVFSGSGLLFDIFHKSSENGKQFIFNFAGKLRYWIYSDLYKPNGFRNPNWAGFVGLSMVLAMIGGLIFGIGLSVTYSSRGTTGGTDLPITYYAITKGKSLGKLNFYVNISIVLFGIIFLYFNDPLHTHQHYSFIQYLTSYKIVGTVIYVIAYSLSLDLFFPRSKKVSIQIITSKAKEIANTLFHKKNFIHTLTEVSGVGMYKNTKVSVLYCSMTYFEYLRFSNYIKTIDPNVFCTANVNVRVIGRFAQPSKFNG